jgi:phosphoglycolate phosphatase-like HAD superfamily hydrolase
MVTFSAVLFDLDGTLWDSEDALVETLFLILKESLAKAIRKQTIRNKLEESSPVQILYEFGISNHSRFWRLYKEHYNLIKLFFENSRRTLRKLGNNGAQLGIVTSLKRQIAIDLLKKFNLIDLMSVTITPSETRARKPSAIPLLKALEALCIDPVDALYVGNSSEDLLSALNAGCNSALATWGIRTEPSVDPDFYLVSLEDIIKIQRGS